MLYRVRLFFSDIRLGFARILAEGKWSRFWLLLFSVIALTSITALTLGCAYGEFCVMGKTGYGASPYEPDNIFDAAYYLLFNNGGQNLYDGNNLLGIIITSIGIVFIAVLTSMITNAFERIGQNYLSGESTFLMKGHIVIIGTSDVIYSILSSKKNQKTRFLIMTSQDVIKKRREVISFLNEDIVFLHGDRTSSKDINRLSIAFAKEVFIIGEAEENDSIESYRDSNNMECVEIIASNKDVIKYRNDTNKLLCHVMFEYQTTFVAFQFSEMGDSFKAHLDFKPFNFYDMWAQKVLVSGGRDRTDSIMYYKYLDTLPNGQFISKDSEQTVHLIIIGMTKSGIALGLEAAQVCHFPNFISDKTKRTRITFIDTNADIEFNYLNGRYRHLFELARYRIINCMSGDETSMSVEWKNDNSWLDVEWEFLKGRVESPLIQSYISKACEDKNHIVTIAACLPRSHQSIATALFLPDIVFSECLQVLVYQRHSGSIIDSIAKPTAQASDTIPYRYKKLRPFGMIDCGYDPLFEKRLDMRSKLISYVYDSYYRTDENENEIHMWDEELKEYNAPYRCYRDYKDYEHYWAENKKVWEKISSQFNAASLETRLRSIGVSKDCQTTCIKQKIQHEITNMQIVEHNRWNIEKLLTGYRALSIAEKKEMGDYWTHWHKDDGRSDEIESHKKEWAKRRKQLKEWPSRAHLDICPFNVLQTCEEDDILTHDKKLNLAIPFILEKERELFSGDA